MQTPEEALEQRVNEGCELEEDMYQRQCSFCSTVCLTPSEYRTHYCKPIRDYYDEAKSIIEGKTLLIPEREHLIALHTVMVRMAESIAREKS